MTLEKTNRSITSVITQCVIEKFICKINKIISKIKMYNEYFTS